MEKEKPFPQGQRLLLLCSQRATSTAARNGFICAKQDSFDKWQLQSKQLWGDQMRWGTDCDAGNALLS